MSDERTSNELFEQISNVLGNAAVEWPHPKGAEDIRRLRKEFDAWRRASAEPSESDEDACRLAFHAWANDLGLCLDEIFMSSEGVPEHPYEDNDTNQFWRAWLASWKAKRNPGPPSVSRADLWRVAASAYKDGYGDLPSDPTDYSGHTYALIEGLSPTKSVSHGDEET